MQSMYQVDNGLRGARTLLVTYLRTGFFEVIMSLGHDI